jgi:hypothetical protein
MSMSDISQAEELVRQFQSLTLPKAAWTHHAHLQIGLWHVLRFSQDEALVRLRGGIRALNESHGSANTDQSGYHETITRFWVLWISQFLTGAEATASVDALAASLIFAAHSNLPLQYYSRERLYSVAARLSWVEPDLKSLGT